MNIKICSKKVVTSTNDWAKQMAKEGAPEGTLAFSDMQSAGRGSHGRDWDSPAGDNIYMSLILRPDILPAHAPMLTLVMGLSVAEAVEDILRADASCHTVKIKWPNDVIIDRKKICGILTEMKMEGSKVDFVVIGCGINVNMDSFPYELADKATSLSIVSGRKIDRDLLRSLVLERFLENYQGFLVEENLHFLLERYNARLVNRNETVRVMGNETFAGRALGINERGELLVETEDGAVRQVIAGEVSVRGLYTYC